MVNSGVKQPLYDFGGLSEERIELIKVRFEKEFGHRPKRSDSGGRSHVTQAVINYLVKNIDALENDPNLPLKSDYTSLTHGAWPADHTGRVEMAKQEAAALGLNGFDPDR